jgi:hypothetical protein
MRRPLLALALLALLAGATPAAAAERVPSEWMGVTIDGPMRPGDSREWNRMARAGVKTVRTAFQWFHIQPKAPAPDGRLGLQLGATDTLVIAAANRGITLLPVIQWPPSWAALRPGLFGSPPRDARDVERIFGALAARYGPDGTLWRRRPGLERRPIRAWQVFNEPNITFFWEQQPFARSYVETLQAAERGLRAADPGARLVLAGLPNESWKALSSIYAAGGRGSFDAVALHPYSHRPANVLRIVRRARRVMRRNGDAAVPIWVTEFSWPAGRPLRNPPDWARGFATVSDREQARLLDRALRRFRAARGRLGIERLVWYTWLSRETRDDPFSYSGLRRIRRGARHDTPALRMFRSWARRVAR